MPRQRFFPRTRAAQALWYHRFASALVELGPMLGVDPAEQASAVADALYLAYYLGSVLPAARRHTKAVTSGKRSLMTGEGAAPVPLPEFELPPLPVADGALPAVVPVPPGAHRRVMRLVRRLQTRPEYSLTVAHQLGTVGAATEAQRPAPAFSLELEQTPEGPRVRVRFHKHGRPGVEISSRRAGGAWETLGLAMRSPFLDPRPVAVPGRPEMREYRLRYFSGSAPTGDYSEVATITVGV